MLCGSFRKLINWVFVSKGKLHRMALIHLGDIIIFSLHHFREVLCPQCCRSARYNVEMFVTMSQCGKSYASDIVFSRISLDKDKIATINALARPVVVCQFWNWGFIIVGSLS